MTIEKLDTLHDVYRQVIKLKRKGLNPTMIVVGEETFRLFILSQSAADCINDALGYYGRPPSLIGIRLHRTIDGDQPFTVLTDGSGDQ